MIVVAPITSPPRYEQQFDGVTPPLKTKIN
jgi:hypothetical protein